MDAAIGPPPRLTIGPTPFIGRRAEVASVEQFLADVRLGHVALLVVDAEAGAGKTTLLRHVVDNAVLPAGFALFSTEGDPNDSRALRCIAEALDCKPTSADPVRVRIAELLRAPSAGAAFGVTAAVQELVLDVIERAAIEAPTVLLIDDMQWVDDASLSLVGSLLRRLRGTNFGVLAATRPSPRVRAALAPYSPLEVRLGPLADDEVAALAEMHSGSKPSVELLAALDSVRANPFLLSALASAKHGEQGGVRRGAGLGRDAFHPLAAGLNADLRMFLELAAVGGRELDVDALAAASCRPLAETVRLTRACVRHGWLMSDGDVVAFRHDLLVEAALATLPIDDRDRLHLALGRSFAQLGHAPGRAAFHLEAASYLLVSADVVLIRPTLAVLPWDDPVVLTLAERARTLAPDDVDVLCVVMHCLAVRHRHAEVVEASQRWLRRASGDAEAIGRVRLLSATSMVPEVGSICVITYLENMLADGTLTAEQQADALNAIARLHWHQRDSALVRSAATRALEASRAVHSIAGEVMALCSRSEANSIYGDIGSALADAKEANRLVVAASLASAAPELALGTAMASSGQMREGLPILTQSLRAAERAGDPQTMVLAQVTMQATRFHIGEWDAFLADADAMADIGRETGMRAGIVLPLGFAAAVAVRRGRFDEVAAIAARLRAENTLGDSHPGAMIGVGFVELAELESAGRLDDACRYATQMADLLTIAGTSAQSLVVLDVARLAWQVGDRTALDAAIDMTGHAASVSHTLARASLHEFTTSLGAADPERLVAAARAVADTQRAWDGATGLHIAGIEATRSQLPDAADLLADASRRYEVLGCHRHAGIALAGLGFDALFGRAAPLGVFQKHDPVALSVAERNVLQLVVDGLPNGDIADALFVSKRTVESHLSSLYRKLGMSTRVALARAGMASGGATSPKHV